MGLEKSSLSQNSTVSYIGGPWKTNIFTKIKMKIKLSKREETKTTCKGC